VRIATRWPPIHFLGRERAVWSAVIHYRFALISSYLLVNHLPVFPLRPSCLRGELFGRISRFRPLTSDLRSPFSAFPPSALAHCSPYSKQKRELRKRKIGNTNCR